jgi:hypothetical protein
MSVINRMGWSWSYGSWIYYYLCNQCSSPLTLWVRIPLRGGVLDTTLCDSLLVNSSQCSYWTTRCKAQPNRYVMNHDVLKVIKYPINRVTVVVFNVTLNNISDILWWSVLLVEETRVPRENHRPFASYWQTLSHNVVVPWFVKKYTFNN